MPQQVDSKRKSIQHVCFFKKLLLSGIDAFGGEKWGRERRRLGISLPKKIMHLCKYQKNYVGMVSKRICQTIVWILRLSSKYFDRIEPENEDKFELKECAECRAPVLWQRHSSYWYLLFYWSVFYSSLLYSGYIQS